MTHSAATTSTSVRRQVLAEQTPPAPTHGAASVALATRTMLELPQQILAHQLAACSTVVQGTLALFLFHDAPHNKDAHARSVARM